MRSHEVLLNVGLFWGVRARLDKCPGTATWPHFWLGFRWVMMPSETCAESPFSFITFQYFSLIDTIHIYTFIKYTSLHDAFWYTIFPYHAVPNPFNEATRGRWGSIQRWHMYHWRRRRPQKRSHQSKEADVPFEDLAEGTYHIDNNICRTILSVFLEGSFLLLHIICIVRCVWTLALGS